MAVNQSQTDAPDRLPVLGAGPVVRKRVDAPHRMGDPPAEQLDPPVASPSEEPLDELETPTWLCDAAPELRPQALDLASRLREWQRTLDHREARLNAHAAQLDENVRGTRLWCDERYVDLRHREEALVRAQQELDAQREQLAAAAAQLERIRHSGFAEIEGRRSELETRASELETKNQQLRQEAELHQATRQELRIERERARREDAWRRQKLATDQETAASALRLARANLENRRRAIEVGPRIQSEAEPIEVVDPPSATADIAAPESKPLTPPVPLVRVPLRQRELEAAEAQLAAARDEIRQLRNAIEAEGQRATEQARAERRRLAEVQQSARHEMARQQSALAQASEQLDARRAELDETRHELLLVHRQALEARVAAEELAAKLSGDAEVGRSLARSRKQLADHYRLRNLHLARQQQELRTIVDEVAQQTAALARERQELEAWLAEQQEKLDRERAGLAEREDQLRRQETQLVAREVGWHSERWQLEQEVRRLMAEQGVAGPSAPPHAQI